VTIASIGRAVRAVVHTLLMVILTGLGAIASLVSAVFDRSGDTVLALARLWSRVIFVSGGVRLDVRGHTALDPARPYVFMANHTSAIDIWALFLAIPVNVRMIAKKQLARVPLLGWAMAAGRFIFIDRQNPLAARRSIEQAAARIRGGSSVVIFPEGTRSRDGRLGPFKKGGFHLAMDAGAAVVPVGIRGAGELMPRGSRSLRPGTVSVEIGAPLSTEGLTAGDRPALLQRVRAEIGRLSGQELAPDPAINKSPEPASSPAAAR
jgi:1-acyl-sn-glycerol-3-phosphate acyltransferase